MTYIAVTLLEPHGQYCNAHHQPRADQVPVMLNQAGQLPDRYQAQQSDAKEPLSHQGVQKKSLGPGQSNHPLARKSPEQR